VAYHFTAEKRGAQDLSLLHDRLARFALVEFFPVEVGGSALTLGVSIPFKAMDDPGFATELVDLMTYLITDQAFEVTDLFTGRRVRADEVPELPQRISS